MTSVIFLKLINYSCLPTQLRPSERFGKAFRRPDTLAKPAKVLTVIPAQAGIQAFGIQVLV
ncbi:hypothetical protein BWD09_11335 [Neisseria dentiae]|uniref:Uncharacterized protein n=1 Tax=Neisseria dentiae TaxID=194197 RepID=A0A1X3D2W0_9NEIS|nr:hypothetical protein BWD09_11335 [Neisseria dentiae]